MRIVLAALMLAVAAPAAAEEAMKDLNGRRFCSSQMYSLTETGAGGYQLFFTLTLDGDLSKATFPGGANLLNPTSFTPKVEESYLVAIDKDGNATERPRPATIYVSGGRFRSGAPGPAASIRLKLESPGMDPMTLPVGDSVTSLAIAAGKLAIQSEKHFPEDVVVADSELGAAMRALEDGGGAVSILLNDAEIARTPIPKPELREQAVAALTWTATTAKAMTARKSCQ